MSTNLAASAQWAIRLGILMSVAAAIMMVGQSSLAASHPLVATAVTIDLLFTIPIAYYLLIRKTSVPKTTVAPVFFLCMLAASLTLPEDGRGLLNAVAMFGVPAVEFVLLGYLAFRLFRMRRSFVANEFANRDLMESIRDAFVQELKPALVARAAAFESAMIAYAFLKWRLPAASGFTYHKLNAPVLQITVFLFLLAAETLIVHILIAMASPTAAWIATAISIYFAIQVVAHLKAMMLRPIVITDEELLIRCGILGDAAIRLDNIAKIEKAPPNSDPGISGHVLTPMGGLSQPNILLHLFGATPVFGAYGIQRRVARISFTVDDPDRFISEIRRNL